MILNGEEVFFVDYKTDKKKKIVYVPLRSYLALLPVTSVVELLKPAKSSEAVLFFARLKQRPLISIRQTLEELHQSTPHLTLALTEDCNLQCLYCYASAGASNRCRSMSKALISKITQKYFKSHRFKGTRAVEVTFMGGGEPTFRFDLLTHAVAECKTQSSTAGVQCAFSIATNGYCGQGTREFLAKNFSNISLSLDGPASMQNVHRPTSTGASSFDVVFETARYLYHERAPMAFRATVTTHSVKRTHEIVDFFSQNFPGTSLAFEVFIPHGRGAHCSAFRAPTSDDFTDALLEAIDYAKGKRIAVVNAAASEYDIVRGAFCSAVGVPNWTVTVDGDITCCARDGAPKEFTFGRYDEVSDAVVLNWEKIAALRAMNVLNYPECSDCFCKYTCAGDCPDRRLEPAYAINCDSIRQVGEYVLNQKIDG
jgi:uncharacterized protein